MYFGYEDIARALKISMESAKVSASRYVKQGFLVRVKRNLYVSGNSWERLSRADEFSLANLLQVPSYISLTTALEYYGITTQIQRGYVQSIDIKRTKIINIKDKTFSYTKIDEDLYFGFARKDDVFIATPEKALLDSLYLASIKKYHFDLASIDKSKINRLKAGSIAKKFPERTLRLWEEICKG